VRGFKDPTIVAGDFNSVRDAPLHGRMRARLRDAFEVAGWGPGFTVWRGPEGLLPFRIDYVYVTEDFAVKSASAPAIDCSDHRPVLAELALR
jgi:endonuclease/exonuclease/phosphatase (EEP) superfamily protein YafD